MQSPLTAITTWVQRLRSPAGPIAQPQPGSQPTSQASIQPLSKERLNWVTARIHVLYEMRVELTQHQARYQMPMFVQHQHGAMARLTEELLLLMVERNVLQQLFQEDTPNGS